MEWLFSLTMWASNPVEDSIKISYKEVGNFNEVVFCERYI